MCLFEFGCVETHMRVEPPCHSVRGSNLQNGRTVGQHPQVTALTTTASSRYIECVDAVGRCERVSNAGGGVERRIV